MQIESRKKKLCLEPLRGIITQGEKMADTVTFRLPATYGALVLSDLSWQIRAASEKNTLATADLTASASGEFCLVQWEVSADFTAVSGALSLMLVGMDSEGNVVIKFPGDDPIWVRDAETGQYSPPEDAIQKALNGLQQAESALEKATKALQEIGINFKILGHYGTLPELEEAVTNPNPGDVYGVGDPTIMYVWNGTSWDPLPGVFQPYPHTNLLVNPRFKYNSRSQQSYSEVGWTVDGWYGYNVTQAGNVLTTQQTDANISQPIKCDLNLLYGKSIAFSIATSGADVVFGTATMPQSFSSTVTVGSASTQWGNIAVYWDSSVSQLKFAINLNQGQSITITAVKLELGSVSTLQAELDNPPPEDVEKLKLDMYDLDPGRCAYLPWRNENLLDNWYFVGGGSQQGGGQFPINQRGKTSYSGTALYSIDRWILVQPTTETVNIESNGISISPSGILVQMFENLGLQNGETVTLSAVIDGVLISGSTTYNASSSYISVVEANGFRLAISPQNKYFQLFNLSGTSENLIQAVKLERGYLSTLARKDESGNWVLNDAPPNFQQELAKCQRYYRNLQSSSKGYIILNGIISKNSSEILLAVPFGSFRTTPTVAINGVIILRNGSGYVEGSAGLSGLSASVSTNSEAGALCLVVRKADGSAFDAPNNTVFSAMLARDCQISFSADL